MKDNKYNYFFHPYEIAFGGYSHSGKTTLISKLIKELSNEYKIAYLKHDIHCFQIDYEDKDTFKAYANGAQSVFISDPQRYAQIHAGSVDDITQRSIFLDADFVLIEGYKHLEIPKIILINKDEKILKKFEEDSFSNVIAFVGEKAEQADTLSEQKYFHWDNLQGIKECVVSYMDKKIQEVPLNGLVLAGGKSTRMKKDKSLLKYHRTTQIEYCYDLLKKFCDQVFISNRQEQSNLSAHNPLPQINDTFLNVGPMGGILSAMRAHPQAAWLVLACDLPFVTDKTIEYLLHKRNPFKYATVYQSSYDEFPEPLCSIYESKMFSRLLKFFGEGYTCPRKVLINSDIKILQQLDRVSLDNVNHPEEYHEAVGKINKK